MEIQQHCTTWMTQENRSCSIYRDSTESTCNKTKTIKCSNGLCYITAVDSFSDEIRTGVCLLARC